MSYGEFHADALEKRGQALGAKRFAVKMRDDALVKKNELNGILFGDGNMYGVLSVVQAYYRLIALGSGRAAKTPNLTDAGAVKQQFAAQLEKSVTPEGDGEGGIHPPDPQCPSSGLDKVDESSVWFNGFSLEVEPSVSEGIVPRITALLEEIGKEASNNADGRGSYDEKELAEAAAEEEGGSGLLGLRTENSEIGGAGPFTVGENGVDKPDTFSTKTAFMRAVQNLISSVGAWKSQMTAVEGILNGEKNGILAAYKIELPEADLPALAKQKEKADEFAAGLDGWKEYFDAFPESDKSTVSSNRAEFNLKLNKLKEYAGEIRDAVNGRCGEIVSLLGDSSAGLRKHLIFWAGEAAKKPDGAYAMFAMAEAMIAEAAEKIAECGKRLNFFDGDVSRWIEVPGSVKAYNEFVMDLDGSVKKTETVFSWDAVMPANKYRLLIKKASDFAEILNDPWDEGGGIWVTEASPETGYAGNEIKMDAPEEPVLARVIAYDTDEGDLGALDRMGSENTRSPQSAVVGEPIPFERRENRDGKTVLMIDKTFGVSGMKFLCANHGIVKVEEVSENLVMLDRDYGYISLIKPLFGYYEPENYYGSE